MPYLKNMHIFLEYLKVNEPVRDNLQISAQNHPAWHWACSQRKESRSESRFETWIGPFPDLKAWFYPLWTQSSFKSGFWNAFWKAKKKGVLDRDPHRKPDSEDMWTQALSELDSCVCIMEMHAEAMHWPISADCAVRTKYYLRSAQILFVNGTAFAMHVNAQSSNHKPNH